MAPRITFKKEGSYYEETTASIKRRIAYAHGFQPSKIKLLEGTSERLGNASPHQRYYVSITFEVCGAYYASDFNELTMLDPEVWGR